MAKRVIAIVTAFLYSLAYTIVGPMVKAQSSCIDSSAIFSFFVWFIFGSVLNILLFSVIPSKKNIIRNNGLFRASEKANESVSRFFERMGDRKLLLITWGFIFLSWIPIYLIVYPGILSYDSMSQVFSAMTVIDSNHHPVLHTWLLRVFMQIGERFLSCYENGIGLFSLLQMILLSYSFARLAILLKKKSVPGLMVLLVIICEAFWFENAVLSVTMTKDILHAVFLILFVCHFTEIVTDSNAYVHNNRNLVFLPIVAFFMFAFRNNGIHIYVFCFAILAVLRIKKIHEQKKYKQLIFAILIPIVLFKIYSGPIFNALEIEQGQVREALCIPIQQLQRVAVSRADQLSAEQTAQMDYYIDNLVWREGVVKREYNPFFADPAKSCFYSVNYEENPAAFWKFYFQIGSQYTEEYVVAFLSNTLGYWYPGYYDFSQVMIENYPPDSFYVPLERKSIIKAEGLSKLYTSVCLSSSWRELYVLRLFFVPGFSLWILIYSIVLAWNRKCFLSKDFPIFLPMVAQFGIMILSPMSSFRYSWPFYLMLPIFFIVLAYQRKTTDSEIL